VKTGAPHVIRSQARTRARNRNDEAFPDGSGQQPSCMPHCSFQLPRPLPTMIRRLAGASRRPESAKTAARSTLWNHPVGIALRSKDIELMFGRGWFFDRPGQIDLEADLLLDGPGGEAGIDTVEVHFPGFGVKTESGFIGDHFLGAAPPRPSRCRFRCGRKWSCNEQAFTPAGACERELPETDAALRFARAAFYQHRDRLFPEPQRPLFVSLCECPGCSPECPSRVACFLTAGFGVLFHRC